MEETDKIHLTNIRTEIHDLFELISILYSRKDEKPFVDKISKNCN